MSLGAVLKDWFAESVQFRAERTKARAAAVERLPPHLRPIPQGDELLTPEDIVKLARVETRRMAIILMRRAGGVRIDDDYRISWEAWRTWWQSRSETASIYTARHGGHAIRSQVAEKVSTGFSRAQEKEAREWLAERKRLAGDTTHAAAAKATLGHWCKETVKAKRADSSEATLRYYRQKLGHFIRVWGSAMSLLEIVPAVCDTYVAQRREEGATGHTITKEFSCLSQVLKLARRAGCYPHQIEALRPLDLKPKYVPRERALPPDEVRKLLLFSSRRLRTFVEVTVALALRRSEALRLAPEDIDLVGGTARIRGTKTEESNAVLPILSPVRSLIEDALPHLPIEVNEKGEYDNLIRDLGRACERAGIARCTPNDLRRSSATILNEAGVPLEFIRRMLRHTTSRMVETVYGKPRPSAIAANIEPHITTLQLPAPDATIDATVRNPKSRKAKKHRKNRSQLVDLNLGPAVYEALPEGSALPKDAENWVISGTKNPQNERKLMNDATTDATTICASTEGAVCSSRDAIRSARACYHQARTEHPEGKGASCCSYFRIGSR